MTFFSRHWSTYRRVLEHDLMEHGALTAALTRTSTAGWRQRGPAEPPPHAVDLGCGDLSVLAPLLRRLPLASYRAWTSLARCCPGPRPPWGRCPTPASGWSRICWPGPKRNRGPHRSICSIPPSPFTTSATTTRPASCGSAAAIWPRAACSSGPTCSARPGKTAPAYVARYVDRIRSGWGALAPEQQQPVIDHLSQFDFPAGSRRHPPHRRGLRLAWQWLWQGDHRAEALAVLTAA